MEKRVISTELVEEDIKIENNFAIYQLKGIFWGNSLVADIIEEIGRSL